VGKGQDLYKKAKTLIPGGTQLLSKRPEQFLPDQWPAYYAKAKGSYVWDLDGTKYADVCYMGIGACSLGFADPDVNRAVEKAIHRGTMTTLNAPEEVELAELMIQLHPWAGKVRYSRTGGEAMTIALRIARSKTGKGSVVFSGYHGWHDWYLSANLGDDSALDGQLLPGLDPAGVPRSLKGTSIPLNYNDTAALKAILTQNPDVGTIVLESVRNDSPSPEFVETVNQASARGVVVIIDEITAGFRLNLGGAHLHFGFKPDIAVFAKSIGNGFPMAVILGKADVMDAAQDTFISSTYWTERMGPAAAIATIKKMQKVSLQQQLVETGHKVMNGWKSAARSAGLDIEVGGIPPLAHFSFAYAKPLVYKTLFTQEMLSKGYLASTSFYGALTHTKKLVDRYLADTETIFRMIKKAHDSGNVESMLRGPVCHSGFKRLN